MLRNSRSAVVLYLLVGGNQQVSGDDQTFAVGVDVGLPAEITAHWLAGEAEQQETDLEARFATFLFNQHPHWRFSRKSTETHAVVSAIAAEAAPGEILLNVTLEFVGLGPARRPLPIGETVLYQPGHFDSFGRPTPQEAADHLWNELTRLLDHRHEASLSTLASNVPLARNPSGIRVPERSIVLPLAKDRYAHLAKSKFRVQCSGPQQLILKADARGEWGTYDQALPMALIVSVTDDLAPDQLEALDPALVYLEKLQPATDWLVFGEGEMP